LTCLVTSRQALGLSGEQEFPVAPLPVPARAGVGYRVSGVGTGPAPPSTQHPTPNTQHLTTFPSVQLFVDRARTVRPDFGVSAANAAAVAEVCAGLDGLPLAIELAAARVQVLSLPQMLAQLERRFDFLVGRQRDVPHRQRTLRATMDWSYQL